MKKEFFFPSRNYCQAFTRPQWQHDWLETTRSHETNKTNARDHRMKCVELARKRDGKIHQIAKDMKTEKLQYTEWLLKQREKRENLTDNEMSFYLRSFLLSFLWLYWCLHGSFVLSLFHSLSLRMFVFFFNWKVGLSKQISYWRQHGKAPSFCLFNKYNDECYNVDITGECHSFEWRVCVQYFPHLYSREVKHFYEAYYLASLQAIACLLDYSAYSHMRRKRISFLTFQLVTVSLIEIIV